MKRPSYLKCDFHIHTTFSDGKVPLREVVDLFGARQFDVIGITDHVHDKQYMEQSEKIDWITTPFRKYLEILWTEREYAWERYEMLLLPGAEFTNNTEHYHILALDVKEFISPDLPVEDIVNEIHRQGGFAIAGHPGTKLSEKGKYDSRHLWENHEKYGHLFDAWEIANRDDLFNTVGLKRLNYVAGSDFHERRHLFSWKTMLYAEKNGESVKAAIRENRNVYIYIERDNKPSALDWHKRSVRGQQCGYTPKPSPDFWEGRK